MIYYIINYDAFRGNLLSYETLLLFRINMFGTIDKKMSLKEQLQKQHCKSLLGKHNPSFEKRKPEKHVTNVGFGNYCTHLVLSKETMTQRRKWFAPSCKIVSNLFVEGEDWQFQVAVGSFLLLVGRFKLFQIVSYSLVVV